MQRRHFEAIAEALKTSRRVAMLKDQFVGISDQPHTVGVEMTIDNVADTFANANPNFKRDVFLRACGLET